MDKILIANIFGIGDVLFTTPLVANLKKEFPEITVDYLANARTKEIVECVPGIGDVFVYEKDDLRKIWERSKKDCINEIYKLFKTIRDKEYDVVFDFTLSREFGFFFMFAGIRRRIGLAYKKRGLFLTDKTPFTGFSGKHVVEYYLGLLKYLDVPVLIKDMRLTPQNDDLLWAGTYIKEKGLGGKKIIAVIPGGGASWGAQASRKRWSAKSFAGAADALCREGYGIILLGDAREKDLLDETAGRMKKPSVIENGLTLKKYIALLSKCELVLCNDGGPLHMAVALGVKTVSIFGPVDEKVYGPYPASSRHKVMTAKNLPCRPCYNRFKLPECVYNNRCLSDITTEEVVEACVDLLKSA